MAAQAEALSGLSSGRQFQTNAPFQGRHLQLASKHGLPWLDFHFVNQIAAFDREIRMPRETHPQKQIAAFSAVCSGFALASEANALSFVDAARNLHLIALDFVRRAAAQRNGSLRRSTS